ncbi:MAG TPA: D-alanyl-lipoteichoic acid biosynthesis protein DltD [Patescibacteria group bacterium]|nr:D-alanyl-lipoteichoic acid biosynthesis protein DltD [Patescibacteria group bacterium]
MNRDIPKFLFKTILFLLPLVIVFGYVEWQLRGMKTTYTIKKRDFEKQLDSVEILVLGSSHALYGIDPAQFSWRGYNLSNSSQTLYYDARLTEKYLSRLPLVKSVIIPVSYFSLWYRLEDTKDAWRMYFYKKFWDIGNSEIRVTDSENFSYTMLYSPKIAFHYWQRGFQDTNVTGTLNYNGWIPAKPHEVNQLTDSLARIRVESHDFVHFENRLNDNMRDLERLVIVLKKRNIDPVLITTPVSELYARYADQEVVTKNENLLKNLAKRFNLQYFNYFSDTRFSLSDFNDNDHLNPQGAIKFSKILDEEALSKHYGNSRRFKKN